MGVVLAACVGLLSASPALAMVEKFEPYAIARVVHDSNFFRLADSQQHLLFDGELLRSKYDNYGNLDHTHINGRGQWNWEVGNLLWSDDLAATYERTLRSFYQTRQLTKDLRTRKSTVFDGGYQATPDWRIEGGLSYTNVDYQDCKDLARKYGWGHLEIQYRNTLNTHVGIRVRRTNYNLQDTVVSGVSVSNDY